MLNIRTDNVCPKRATDLGWMEKYSEKIFFFSSNSKTIKQKSVLEDRRKLYLENLRGSLPPWIHVWGT